MTWYRRPAVLAVLVALIGVVVFTPSVGGGWIYDDHLLIPENPYIHSLDWWPRWFLTGFWDIGEEFVRRAARPLMMYWRPTITVTYAIDWQVGGGTPVVFHVTNLVWHGAVGALAFVVLRRWIGATWPAVLAALVFVVHPTKAECVAWIAGRTDIVCMAGMLLATQGIARRLRGARGGLLLEVFGTLLAYTSKEQSIVLPALAAVEGWVAAGRPAIDRKAIVAMLRVAWPQLVVAVTYLTLRHFLLPISGPKPPGPNSPLPDHVQAVFESMGRYVELTFAPHDLTIQHGLVRVEQGASLHSVPYMVLGGIAIVVLVGGAFVLRRRSPIVTVGIAFYALTLSPTLNIIDMQMETLISERFLFLPTFGIALAIGGVLARWPRRWIYLVVSAAIVVAGAIAIDRSLDYGNEDTFWERELAMHPRSPEARRARIRVALRQKRYQTALAETLELARWATQNQDVPAAADAAQLLADLTPDRDRRTLEVLDTFASDLLAKKHPTATLDAGVLKLQIPTTTRYYDSQLAAHAVRLLQLRSNLRSRLGDDAAAIELAKDALARCPACSSAIVGAALTFARAAAYDEAVAILDQSRPVVARTTLDAVYKLVEASAAEHARSLATTGPAQLQARAASLAALELWGRAYDVLAPHKEQIKRAPKVILGFAELAFRAGDPATAREMLEIAGVADIDAQLASWAAVMGWRR